jgi:hypothetical protein
VDGRVKPGHDRREITEMENGAAGYRGAIVSPGEGSGG